MLADVRGRWDAGHRPLALAPLEAWFEAVRWLAPGLRAPDVAPTWFELLPAPDLPDVDEMARAADWLALMELLGRYDPTTLLRLGGAERMHAVVEAARQRIPECPEPERAALLAILDRAAALMPEEADFATLGEWELPEPPSAPDPAEEVIAAYAERRLVERVLRDL